jgi:chemotaxis signal transduction protein
MASNNFRFLTFRLDHHLCAIHVKTVKEINHIYIADPNVKEFLPVTLQMRDQKIPLIDFRKKIGLLPQPLNHESRVIIIDSSKGLIGIGVDAVQSIIALPAMDWANDSEEELALFESIEILGNTLIVVDILTCLDSSQSNLAEAFRSATSQLVAIAS